MLIMQIFCYEAHAAADADLFSIHTLAAIADEFLPDDD